METVLFDDVIETDYGQLDLVWTEQGGFDGDDEIFFHGQANGLVGAADERAVYINLARRAGGSRVRVALFDAEPSLPPERYEDVVAVSFTLPAGAAVQWESWARGSFGDLPGVTPGSYRLRVSAHGGDAGREGEFADGVVDDYRLDLWPAGPAPDEVLRVGSEDAAYWHREWGGRR